jgi:hypothetical protein
MEGWKDGGWRMGAWPGAWPRTQILVKASMAVSDHLFTPGGTGSVVP